LQQTDRIIVARRAEKSQLRRRRLLNCVKFITDAANTMHQRYQECRLHEGSEELAIEQRDITQQQAILVDRVMTVFNVRSIDDVHCSIASHCIHDDIETSYVMDQQQEDPIVSAGMGYIALLTDLVAKYLNMRLPFQIVFRSSRSYIVGWRREEKMFIPHGLEEVLSNSALASTAAAAAAAAAAPSSHLLSSDPSTSSEPPTLATQTQHGMAAYPRAVIEHSMNMIHNLNPLQWWSQSTTSQPQQSRESAAIPPAAPNHTVFGSNTSASIQAQTATAASHSSTMPSTSSASARAANSAAASRASLTRSVVMRRTTAAAAAAATAAAYVPYFPTPARPTVEPIPVVVISDTSKYYLCQRRQYPRNFRRAIRLLDANIQYMCLRLGVPRADIHDWHLLPNLMTLRQAVALRAVRKLDTATASHNSLTPQVLHVKPILVQQSPSSSSTVTTQAAIQRHQQQPVRRLVTSIENAAEAIDSGKYLLFKTNHPFVCPSIHPYNVPQFSF
jgi:hypothetical protein